MNLEQIRQEIITLSEKDKGLLAGDILSSMRPSQYHVSDEGVAKRVEETASGRVQDISFDELRRRFNK